MFKNTCFEEHLRTAASALNNIFFEAAAATAVVVVVVPEAFVEPCRISKMECLAK